MGWDAFASLFIDIHMYWWYLLVEGIAAYRKAARPYVVAVNVSWRLFIMIDPLKNQPHNPNAHQHKRAELI